MILLKLEINFYPISLNKNCFSLSDLLEKLGTPGNTESYSEFSLNRSKY